MNKQKKLLIVGCSHCAGSEIDGTQDSAYNRSKSFGSILANMLDREPINISLNGSTNSTISRTCIEYIENNYNSDLDDMMVLIAWTESARIEMPSGGVDVDYFPANEGISMYPPSCKNFYHINLGYKGIHDHEKSIINDTHKFMIKFPTFVEILSANFVLQLQYFCKSKNIPYIMCNTMHMFEPEISLNYYIDLIDKKNYFGFYDREGFYWKYRNLGFNNPKATYWHHGEEPHRLFANELYQFLKK